MNNAGSVELSVTLALAGLINDAKKAQADLEKAIGSVEVPIKPTIPEGAYRDAMGKLRDAKGRFIKEGEEAGSAYGDGFGNALNRALDGIFQGIGQEITQITLAALQQATQVLIGLGQAGLDASDRLNSGIAAVNSLGADGAETAAALGQLSEDLGGLASTNDLVAASYDVLSSKTETLAAGLTDAEVATNILGAATKGAKGGFSDTATVADALTSVLNSYRLSATEAEAVTAKIIATQNAGKITAGEYAAQIGRLAPTAAQAGVSLDELNGFIATATSQGVPVESTFAGIRQALSALLKPSDDAQAILEKVGITNGAAALQSEGLVGVLSRLNQAGLDTPENLTKLLGSVEALTAIAPSAGQNIGVLTSNIERSKDALANGELDTALNAVASTAESNFANAINLAQNSLIKLGDAIVPARNSFLELAAGIISAVTDTETGTTAFDAIGAASERFSEAIRNNPALLEAIKNTAVQVADTLGQLTAATLDALAAFAGSDEAADGFTILAEQIDQLGDLIAFLIDGLQTAGAVFDVFFGPVIDLVVVGIQTLSKFRDLIEEVAGKIEGLGDRLQSIPVLRRFLPGGDEPQSEPVADQAFNENLLQNRQLPTPTTTTEPQGAGGAGGTPPAQTPGRDFERELKDLENGSKLYQAALLASGRSEAEIREAQFQAEQEFLNRRIQLNAEKEAELRAQLATATDPEAKKKLEEQLLDVESEVASDRLTLQQNLADNRERLEKETLDRIERANQEAAAAIDRSQQERTIAVRQAQADGVLSAQEAEREIAAIQDDASAQLIAQKQRELEQVRALRAQGTLDAEQAANREAELQGEIGAATLERLKNQIELQRKAAEEAIEAQFAPLQRQQQGELNSADLASSALSRQNDLLSAQAELQGALNDLQNSQLERAIAVAESEGKTAEATRLRVRLQEQQQAQLLEQEAIQRRQLELEQRQADLALRREQIAARIAAIEAEAELARLRATGATEEQIKAQEQLLALRQQQVGELQAAASEQAQIQALQQATLAARQQVARNDLRQSQIGELQQMGAEGGFSREMSQRLNALRNTASTPIAGGLDVRSLAQPAVMSPALTTPALAPATGGKTPPVSVENLDGLADTFRSGIDQISGLIQQLQIANTFNINGVENGDEAAQRVARELQAQKRRLAGR